MNLIDFYNKSLESGVIPCTGLCPVFYGTEHMIMFYALAPTTNDELELSSENLSVLYWASGEPKNTEAKYYNFTPLRQTIVAFMIAMEELGYE
jgi:hypothetical protein